MPTPENTHFPIKVTENYENMSEFFNRFRLAGEVESKKITVESWIKIKFVFETLAKMQIDFLEERNPAGVLISGECLKEICEIAKELNPFIQEGSVV